MSDRVAAAIAVGPGEGTTVQGPAGGPLTFKVRGEQTCGRLTAVENEIVGDSPVRILVMFNPSGMERFFDRFAELPAVDPSAFARIGAEVGMELLGPPLG